MDIDFDIKNVKSVNFGVGYKEASSRKFVELVVDQSVQDQLESMVVSTTKDMSGSPEKFEPSEDYTDGRYTFVPTDDPMVTQLSRLHSSDHLNTSDDGLAYLRNCFCYFARFRDNQDKRLTALRRAAQFKAGLKNRSRLISWVDNALQVVEDPIFRLNETFDILIDSKAVHIVHPSSFKELGQIDLFIQRAVSDNIQMLEAHLTNLNWAPIQEYAETHPRAAKLLASIRSNDYASDINLQSLKDSCNESGIAMEVNLNGNLTVPEDQILIFLEILDRRRYSIKLVDDNTEGYRATSRQRV